MEFTLAGSRVMVVDDDLSVHSLMGTLLAHWGCEQVELLPDGFAAVERYRYSHPDLVIMDVEMPGMNGHAAARAIRELDQEATILLLTGVPDGRLARMALEEGLVKAVIPKPFGFEQLKMAIKEALKGKGSKPLAGKKGAVA